MDCPGGTETWVYGVYNNTLFSTPKTCMAHWDGTPETEARVQEETKATIRCIPFDGDKTPGKCMVTGKPSAQRVLFARAY